MSAVVGPSVNLSQLPTKFQATLSPFTKSFVWKSSIGCVVWGCTPYEFLTRIHVASGPRIVNKLGLGWVWIGRLAFGVFPFFFFFFFCTRLWDCGYCSYTVQWTVVAKFDFSIFSANQCTSCTDSWTHKFHFSITFSLKMGPAVLFTHLKIILLQYFSVFGFQLYPNGPLNYTWKMLMDIIFVLLISLYLARLNLI